MIFKSVGLPILFVAVIVLPTCRTAERRSAETDSSFVTNRMVVPVNQTLAPAGKQVDLPGMRPQMIALSPDGHLLATSGKTHDLVLVDPATGKILQRVALPSEDDHQEEDETVSARILKPDHEGQSSYTGLIFSRDGKKIFLSNVNGSVKVFGVGQSNRVDGLLTLPLPPSGIVGRRSEIPAGLALSHDEKKLYVAANLSNRLLELDAKNGALLRTFDVGFAPYEVVLRGNKAYVSNWGGRRPDAQSPTAPAGRGTFVRVDPVRFVASEGSISIIDLESGKVLKELLVGLHASAICLAPDGRFVCVANAGSDSVSVIDTQSDTVVETISLHWQPKDLLGASPNALAFDKLGKKLFICNGTQNAVAVVSFQPGKSRLSGLIPTGWYPGAVAFDAKRNALYVANIKGIGSGWNFAPKEKIKLNSHQSRGTLSLIPVPGRSQLKSYTKTVWRGYQKELMEQALLPARPNVGPRPVPERAGEPSVFKHVVYIIKENRTYDQVLGDMKEGNGDSTLCLFGENVTPNQHKLSREFVLLDNTRCSGILSADGHQWADSAFTTDYMERSFAGFPRSYPDGMEENGVDALAYSSAGFIWDNALACHETVRIFGEFVTSEAGWKEPGHKGRPGFNDFYADYLNHTELTYIRSRPNIESLRPYAKTDTIGWNPAVLDDWRARKFIEELHDWEGKGEMPNLCILSLPNDHTSGTQAGFPTPAAQVADNDLAVGHIIDALSHSQFWKDSAVFIIEDDPQNGFDHVSGYRTTAYVASAFTKRGAVVHTLYNQTSLIRTMELILGLPPMNQLDATAMPMSDCFSETPDFSPFQSVKNNVPLDQLNPPISAIHDPVQRKFAKISARLPLDDEDDCPEDVLNRILWFAQKGDVPYPSWAIAQGTEK